MNEQLAPYIVTPAPSNSYWYMGALLTFHATGEQTGGQFMMFEVTVRKGYVVPPHTHTREDESFYIIEGAMDCVVGGRSVHAKAGDFVFLPRNIEHTWTSTVGPTRFLVWMNPAGIEKSFTDLAVPAPRLELPPEEPITAEQVRRLIETDKAYGVFFAGHS